MPRVEGVEVTSLSTSDEPCRVSACTIRSPSVTPEEAAVAVAAACALCALTG